MACISNDVAVAILPYGAKLGLFPSLTPLDKLKWPLGRPERLTNKTLGDMKPCDHLIIYPTTAAHFRPTFGTQAHVSMMLVEPKAIHLRHFNRLRWTYRRFYRILSAQEELLGEISNGCFFPFGSTWVLDWKDLDTSKSANISLIASLKRDHEGHKLRHEIAEWSINQGVDLELVGGGYKPFGRKAEGLAQYRFSVVIENVREKNYFTEKLIDAILCNTIPIYWGCPNIDRFLDTKGMIICDSIDELKEAICSVDIGVFENKLPLLQAIRQKAAYWADLEVRAARTVLEAL